MTRRNPVDDEVRSQVGVAVWVEPWMSAETLFNDSLCNAGRSVGRLGAYQIGSYFRLVVRGDADKIWRMVKSQAHEQSTEETLIREVLKEARKG